MARFSAGALAAGAGSTSLPSGSVYGIANFGFRTRECGIYNTTATACAYKLARLSAAGTQGTGLTETGHDTETGASFASQATAFNTHTAGTPVGADLGYRAQLGAAVGSAMVWTFGDSGIRVSAGTANGIGVVVENGTGQVLQFYFVWDE